MAARTKKKAQPKSKGGTAKRRAAKPAARRTASRAASTRSTARKSSSRGTAGRQGGGAARMGVLSAEQGVPVDGLRLLEQDHREVESLFSQFKTLDGAREKAAMAARICLLLKVHTRIEEEILYPAARKALDDDGMVNEAEVEHTSARQLIAQIEAMKPRDHLFDAKVKVLGEYVHHHVEEEETEFFPALRDTELDFYKIGAALTARKLALLAKLTGKA